MNATQNGTALAVAPVAPLGAAIERVLVEGDLTPLTPDQRVAYYKATCESVGLNPLTKPFDYLRLNGKLILYANKNASDQLRKIHGISIVLASKERVEDVYVVTARATDRAGRVDESTGAVPMHAKMGGEALANSLMKCETKAKRRVTLSIVGLSMLDESEVETIPGAQHITGDGEVVERVGPRPQPTPDTRLAGSPAAPPPVDAEREAAVALFVADYERIGREGTMTGHAAIGKRVLAFNPNTTERAWLVKAAREAAEAIRHRATASKEAQEAFSDHADGSHK
jgi:hypothetical protein